MSHRPSGRASTHNVARNETTPVSLDYDPTRNGLTRSVIFQTRAFLPVLTRSVKSSHISHVHDVGLSHFIHAHGKDSSNDNL